MKVQSINYQTNYQTSKVGLNTNKICFTGKDKAARDLARELFPEFKIPLGRRILAALENLIPRRLEHETPVKLDDILAVLGKKQRKVRKAPGFNGGSQEQVYLYDEVTRTYRLKVAQKDIHGKVSDEFEKVFGQNGQLERSSKIVNDYDGLDDLCVKKTFMYDSQGREVEYVFERLKGSFSERLKYIRTTKEYNTQGVEVRVFKEKKYNVNPDFDWIQFVSKISVKRRYDNGVLKKIIEKTKYSDGHSDIDVKNYDKLGNLLSY